jgi:CRP/FNR family cyclic AMP-dependent transcriptional regulator
VFDEQARRDLRSRGRRRSFERGEMILIEGDSTDAVVLIEDGHVKVWATTESGDEVLLAVRGPGEMIGELSALDGMPRSACAQAMEDVTVTSVPSSAFESFLLENPPVLLMIARDLAGRLRDADTTRVALSAYSVDVRVAYRLLDIADRHGSVVDAGIRIDLPLSQEELAKWTGASREAVSRVLQSLRDQGVIETRRRQITVRDRVALERRTIV